MNKTLITQKKSGLIIGSCSDTEAQLKKHFSENEFNVRQEESIESAAKLLKENEYDFILAIDRAQDNSIPDLLHSLLPVIPQKKIIVLIDAGGMKKYADNPTDNIFGYFHKETEFSLLRFLVCQIPEFRRTQPDEEILSEETALNFGLSFN